MTDAIVIFQKLALQNYPPAQAALGDIMDYTLDHEVAAGWYIMAAFQGNAHGAFGLARSYQEGLGINKDPDQAFYWYKFAADKDNLNAIKLLMGAYQQGAVSGISVPVDLKQAEYWTAKSIPLEAARAKKYKESEVSVKKKYEDEAAAAKKVDEEAAKKSQQRTTK
jgi:TPR repeat protein